MGGTGGARERLARKDVEFGARRIDVAFVEADEHVAQSGVITRHVLGPNYVMPEIHGSGLAEDVVGRYLARIGLDGSDVSLVTLQNAHVHRVPFENLEIPLGRPVSIDVPSLADKIVDRRRGGYCFELNTLYAAALEALGYTVSRRLGRVRLGDAVNPRAATHMTLVVDEHVVDVGFGAANPVGPVPLGGEATYGRHTWGTKRVVSPEGDEVWLVSLGDRPLFTFDDVSAHPIDFVAPNYYTSTHPQSSFTQAAVAQRWDEDGVHVSVNGLELTERGPDGPVTSPIKRGNYAHVLRDRFGIELESGDVKQLLRFIAGRSRTSGV